ncbi:MAG TPA: hypothetical protein VKB72_14710 [Steroidobacteraceae bacterium]|nr:hypothetical protein [Steroidobacteraceae bacterium]
MHDDLEQRRTLAQLLRGLPQETAPPYGFREFQRRARRRAAGVRGVSVGQLLAASVLVALGIVAVSLRLAGPREHPLPVVSQSATADAPARAAATAPDTGSDALERLLASLPREPAVARVGERAAVIGLEDRIAQVDDLLSAARSSHAQPARVQKLQEERTRLVGALLQVRYAETLADASR